MVTEPLLSISYAIVGVLFGVLIIILGWLGNRVMNKLDFLSENILHVSHSLNTKTNEQDMRITRIETLLEVEQTNELFGKSLNSFNGTQ